MLAFPRSPLRRIAQKPRVVFPQRATMHDLQDNLSRVHGRMQEAAARAGRSPDQLALIAVSKKQSAAAMRALCAAGQQAFGESYLQEALDKQQELADLPIEWHFIGPIQSNKTRAIAERFSWVHSVDRLKIAERLNQQRPQELPPLNICLQVNIDRETSKSGVTADDLPALATAVSELPRLRLRGLMSIPAPREDYEGQLAAFAELRKLLEELRRQVQNAPLDSLSMGMSSDMEAAIAAGATLVRVGTDLFGARQ